MTLRKLDITVRFLAKRIIKEEPDLYNQELIRLIPKEIAAIELSDENLFSTGELIDGMRFSLEHELAMLLGLPKEWRELPEQREKWKEAVADPDENLLPDQKKIYDEMKFLFVLACTVIHQ